MKKNYLKPEIECSIVSAIFALCEGTIQNNGKDPISGSGTPTPPGGAAPRRRPF